MGCLALSQLSMGAAQRRHRRAEVNTARPLLRPSLVFCRAQSHALMLASVMGGMMNFALRFWNQC